MHDTFKTFFDNADKCVVGWMGRYGHFLLRVTLGAIFVWFGALKIWGVSSAGELVEKTVPWLDPQVFVPLLGWWEVLIGLGFWVRPFVRLAVFLLFMHMPGTLLPLVLLPDVCFVRFPFVLTLEGQYIIKNLVLASAAIVIGGTVRKRSDIWV